MQIPPNNGGILKMTKDLASPFGLAKSCRVLSSADPDRKRRNSQNEKEVSYAKEGSLTRVEFM